jgi:hypothetical protein
VLATKTAFFFLLYSFFLPFTWLCLLLSCPSNAVNYLAIDVVPSRGSWSFHIVTLGMGDVWVWPPLGQTIVLHWCVAPWRSTGSRPIFSI